MPCNSDSSLGDGTNDAPALHEANIGLAMGIAGTEVAKESDNVIILDDNFSTIVTVAKWGRSVYITFKSSFSFSLRECSCNCCSVPMGEHDHGYTWSSCLATEQPNNELMKRLPVGRRGNFITNAMWRNILGQSVYQFIFIWFLQGKGKSMFGLDGPDSTLMLNTLIFNCFIFCQVFNEISS